MRQFEKKICQNFRMIKNRQLSKQQLKVKIIHRKGGMERPKSLVF